jgi:hypothetical protein
VKSFRLVSATFTMLFLFVLIAGCNKSDSPASGDNSASGGSSSGSKGSDSDARAAAEKRVITIPAGTSITIRTAQTLSSKDSHAGESFSGTVTHPVAVDGQTVIEEGSPAQGTVVDAKGMGHFKGGALLHLRLTSVTIRGKEYPIETTATGGQLKGKGKRSAVIIGGGAGAGALIGGLLGGGKGAAIGAGAGAGAGTGGAAFTGNKQIVFPAESALTFRLRAPVEVK